MKTEEQGIAACMRLNAKQRDLIDLMRDALERIRDFKIDEYDQPAEEWAKHTPETCSECKRWRDMNHPIQHSCNGWYDLYYSRERRNKDNYASYGYHMRTIAEEALYAASKLADNVTEERG